MYLIVFTCRHMFGDERVFVEHVKKENRKHDVSNMSLRQFLEVQYSVTLII